MKAKKMFAGIMAITMLVWYPNESAEDYQEARNEVGKLIEQATGKTVEQKLTTDYAIAIESLSNGTAQIGCCMGAEGYIQAKNSNDAVNPLFVQSGESGTLDDALYYSFFAVKEENAEQYLDGDSYSIENIKGRKMSFVSNSSTSGFKVPTNQKALPLTYFQTNATLLHSVTLSLHLMLPVQREKRLRQVPFIQLMMMQAHRSIP